MAAKSGTGNKSTTQALRSYQEHMKYIPSGLQLRTCSQGIEMDNFLR